jgi:hypothetical protein
LPREESGVIIPIGQVERFLEDVDDMQAIVGKMRILLTGWKA